MDERDDPEFDSWARDIALNFVRLKSGFEGGDSACALHAILFASHFRVEVPDWALAHAGKAILAWNSAEVRTLDEAFGVVRPKGFRLETTNRQVMHGGAVLIEVNKLLESESYSDDIFEAVGDRWGMGKTATKELYYRELALMKRHFPESHARMIASRTKSKRPAVPKKRKG